MLAARLHGIPAAALAAIAGAWALAVAAEATGEGARLHHDALLEGGPPVWVSLPLFLVAWQAMVAAMMLPGSLPLMRLFAAASAAAPRRRAAIAAFLGGYAAVWGVFGAAAFLGDAAFHALVHRVGWLEANAWAIPPAVLALAGAFQFSGLKDRCLDECRHPGAFLLRHYGRGPGRAFRLGRRHGLFCLGCCWALMLLMFSVGIASLWWMAALTLLMLHERTRPSGARTVPVTGVLLLGAAAIMFAYNGWMSGALG